jgi:hypothetical protein
LVQPDATTGPGRLVSLRDIAMVSGNLWSDNPSMIILLQSEHSIKIG